MNEWLKLFNFHDRRRGLGSAQRQYYYAHIIPTIHTQYYVPTTTNHNGWLIQYIQCQASISQIFYLSHCSRQQQHFFFVLSTNLLLLVNARTFHGVAAVFFFFLLYYAFHTRQQQYSNIMLKAPQSLQPFSARREKLYSSCIACYTVTHTHTRIHMTRVKERETWKHSIR